MHVLRSVSGAILETYWFEVWDWQILYIVWQMVQFTNLRLMI